MLLDIRSPTNLHIVSDNEVAYRSKDRWKDAFNGIHLTSGVEIIDFQMHRSGNIHPRTAHYFARCEPAENAMKIGSPAHRRKNWKNNKLLRFIAYHHFNHCSRYIHYNFFEYSTFLSNLSSQY